MHLRTLGVVACLFVCATGAFAQKPPSEEEAFHKILEAEQSAIQRPGEVDEDLLQLVEKIITIRLQRYLELTDAQALSLAATLGNFKGNIAELKFERSAQRELLRQCLADGAHEELIAQKLENLLTLDERIAKLLREMVEHPVLDLNLPERAKLYLFVGDFEDDMRRLIDQARATRQGDGPDAVLPASGGDSDSRFRALVRSENRDVTFPNPEEADNIRLVDTLLMARMSQALNLSTEETVVLVRHVGTYKDQLHQIKWQIGAARQDLRETLEQGAPTPVIQEKLDDLLLQEAATADLVRTLVTESQRDVTIAQSGRLYIFLGDFEDDVERLLERANTAGARAPDTTTARQQ